MRVVEITGGFGLDALKLADRPPLEPGPGQIVVRMKAWSLNFRDLLVVTGKYNPKLKLPMCPLSDGAGEVASVGPGVTRVKPGDRVAPIFMQSWLSGGYTDAHGRTALGGAIPGVLADEVLVSSDGVVKIPDHLTDAEAATLPCAAVTAWNALVAQGNVKAGDTVLLLGTGGVSLFALAFARMHGARVILTSSSDEKLERARSLGADETINYRTVPDWGKRVRELTGGAGVDHVVEIGGTGTLAQSMAAARGGGIISIIGNVAGLSGEISLGRVIHQHLRLQGIFVGSREMFESMNRAISQHQMKPVIDSVHPMDAAAAAFGKMEQGGHFGKIVLTA